MASREDTFDDVPVKVLGTSADPAAGAECATFTVSAGKRWEIHGWSASLVASADVANRYPQLFITLNGTIIIQSFLDSVAHTASATARWTFETGKTPLAVTPAALGANMNVGIGFFPKELPAAATIYVVTTGIQAADNWGVATLYGKELPSK
jgi:hypothetical protein